MAQIVTFEVVGAAAGAAEGVIETMATFADPTELTGRDTDHEGIIFDIFGDHGTGANEGRTAYGVTTDNRTVGTEGSTFPDECLGIDAVNREMSTRCRDIGEDAGRTAEHVVLNLYAFIDGNIVLDTDTIANADIIANIDILTQRAVLAEAGTTLDVAEMPYLCAFADFYIIIDKTTRMYEILFHIFDHELRGLHEFINGRRRGRGAGWP